MPLEWVIFTGFTCLMVGWLAGLTIGMRMGRSR